MQHSQSQKIAMKKNISVYEMHIKGFENYVVTANKMKMTELKLIV